MNKQASKKQLTAWNSASSQSPLCREDITYCYAGCVWYAWKGRNAWHTSWSSRYLRDSSFALSFEEAAEAAEMHRVRGTVWKIRKLPACALVTDSGLSLVLTEINTLQPLDDLETWLPVEKALDHVASRFAPTPTRNLVRLLTTNGLERITNMDIYWHAVPQGSGQPLSWSERQKDATSVSSVERFASTADQWSKIKTTAAPDTEG